MAFWLRWYDPGAHRLQRVAPELAVYVPFGHAPQAEVVMINLQIYGHSVHDS